MHKWVAIRLELHAHGASDFISIVGDEYSTGDHVTISGRVLQMVLEYTSAWKALRRFTKRLPELRSQLCQTAPVTFYDVEYKYLGIFELIPGYSHGIITLLHDVLGTHYVTRQNADELRKLDAVLARIAAS